MQQRKAFSYRKEISHPETLPVLMRVPHIAIDIWKYTMATPWSYIVLNIRSIRNSLPIIKAYLHIIRPKLSGTAIQLSGSRYVVAGSNSDPGDSGLINPSAMTIARTLEKHH
jgi:hypothetical protein